VPLRFLGAWTLQAVWVVLVQMPIILLSQAVETRSNALSLACLLVWLTGFVLEAVADVQKFEFRQDPAKRHRFIQSGLWAHARHPNYFGEITMWTAAAAAASICGVLTSNRTLHLAWLSPAFTSVLLLKVSGVPMITAAGEKKWGHEPAYQHYIKHTNLLLPGSPAPPLGGSGGGGALI